MGQKFWEEFSYSKEDLIKNFKNYGYRSTVQFIAEHIVERFSFMKYWIPEESLDSVFQDVKDYRVWEKT